MFFRSVVPTLLACISLSVYAVGEGGTKIEFSGTVVEPPSCTINNNKVIEVQFGLVGVNKADGKQILKTLDYNLQCKGSDGSKDLKMMISGSQAFAEDVLITSIKGLGVRFYHDGEAVTLRQWFNMPKAAGNMVLTASPIVQPGFTPEMADFEAAATLIVAFQ